MRTILTESSASGYRLAMRIGAHMSIAGGVHLSVERAGKYEMTALQIFTRSSRTWSPPALAEEHADAFRRALGESPIESVVAHASYLVNPASSDAELRKKSERALLDELTRCEALGVPWLVLHPGSATGGDRKEALRQAGRALRRIFDAARGFAAGFLVENAAGQGTTIGTTPEEVATILGHAGDGERLGVCIDTCHAFAAGFDLRSEKGFLDFRGEIDREIGLERVRAIHVNDSKKPLGCRVDRHEGIGLGEMGLTPFLMLVRDPVFRELPLILETPKGKRDDVDLDARNLRVLRGLVSS